MSGRKAVGEGVWRGEKWPIMGQDIPQVAGRCANQVEERRRQGPA